jgi:hypothetical protein
MASSPDEEGLVPDKQRADDPETIDLSSLQKDDQPQQRVLGSAAVSAPQEDQSQSRSLLKKFLRPIALAVVGGVLIVVALILYPSPSELSTPSYATLDVRSSFPLQTIGYVVNQMSPSIAMITIELVLPTGVLQPPPQAPNAYIALFPPPGIAFKSCSAGCTFNRVDNVYEWSGTLKVNSEYNFGGNLTGVASATFLIRAHDFGYVSDSDNASAAIPAVTYSGQGSPLLETAYYDATSVTTYDWSALQPESASGTRALWDEPLVSGATQGRIAIGIDHASETNDNNKTFFAGALIGLAGGALLSAVQEALHAND